MIKIIDDYIAQCKEKLIYAVTRRTETFIAPYVCSVGSVPAVAKNMYACIAFFSSPFYFHFFP